MSSEATNYPWVPNEYRPLGEFSREAWGHPERFLKKISSDVGDIEYIDLGKYLTTIEHCFPGTKLGLVIVRNEYRLALEALQQAEYTNGAYVTGQPGIGKTSLLLHLLTHLLGQKIAVALQLPHNYYAFFTGEGASIQPVVVADLIDEYEGSMWALCDSNQEVTIPSSVFSQLWPRMRVVLTTPPQRSRWKEWAKQTGACPYIMDIWSIGEVKQLAVLSNLIVERMVELARKWGGVPQTILKYYYLSDHVAEGDYCAMAELAMTGCRMTLVRGHLFDLPDGVPASFYFIRPKNNPDGRMTPPSVSIPTRTLRCLLAEVLQRQVEVIKFGFLGALCASSETQQSACYIYESWFHSLLSTPDQSLTCKWVSCGGATQEISSTPNIISAIRDKPVSWIPPFYWIPPNRNFPGIDSALVLPDKIIAFQVTVAKEHKKSALRKGLAELYDLLPENLKGLPWNLVFVGTPVDQIEKVAVSQVNKLSPANRESIRVGWTVVDPMREGVIYTHHRDEDDLVVGGPIRTN